MENILGKKTGIRILSTLIKNASKEFKEIELIRKSKVGKGSAANAINELSSLGIIRIRRVGKTKVISLNLVNPVAFGIKQIFDQMKLLSLPENKLSAVLFLKQRIYNYVKAIVLFGSLITEGYTENSDIDLLVMTEREKEVRRIKREISGFTDERTNLHFLKPEELSKEIKDNDLVRNACLNGIIIYGGNFIKEVLRSQDLRDIEFLKERIEFAWKNYADKDYESLSDTVQNIVEHMAFLACRSEGEELLSRKDALSEIKKMHEYKILSEIGKFETKRRLKILEDIYQKLFNKIILKGEEIERKAEK